MFRLLRFMKLLRLILPVSGLSGRAGSGDPALDEASDAHERTYGSERAVRSSSPMSSFFMRSMQARGQDLPGDLFLNQPH
jgi:hypothetical protein